MDFKSDARFKGLEPFLDKIWLSSPTMHGEELRYVTEAYQSNWMSTVGENMRLYNSSSGVSTPDGHGSDGCLLLCSIPG